MPYNEKEKGNSVMHDGKTVGIAKVKVKQLWR